MLLFLLIKPIFSILSSSLHRSPKTLEIKPLVANNKPILVFHDTRGLDIGFLTRKDSLIRNISKSNFLTANIHDNMITHKKKLTMANPEYNQIFKLVLVKENKFMMRIYSNKCLNYIKDQDDFILKECSLTNKFQIFDLVSGVKSKNKNHVVKRSTISSLMGGFNDNFGTHFIRDMQFLTHGPTVLPLNKGQYPDKKKYRRFSESFYQTNNIKRMDDTYYRSLSYIL